MADEITDSDLVNLATTPKSATIGDQSFTMPDVEAAMKLQTYLDQKKAQKKANRGLRTIQIRFPGSAR